MWSNLQAEENTITFNTQDTAHFEQEQHYFPFTETEGFPISIFQKTVNSFFKTQFPRHKTTSKPYSRKHELYFCNTF